MLLAATAARAFDFWADNADGKRLYYSYDGNSKVKVVNPDWDSFTQPSGVLRIPATVINGATTFSVTAIDTKAFEYCADITTVVIPEGVTSIGRMAFAYCTALDSVALPSTLTSIGTMAFTGTSFFSSSHLNDDGLLIAGNYLIGSRSSITGSIAVPDHDCTSEELAAALSEYIKLFDKLMKAYVSGRLNAHEVEAAYYSQMLNSPIHI